MALVNIYDEPYWSWLGPLASLLEDPEVTCLIADGSSRLWMEKRHRLAPVPGALPSGGLEGLVSAIADALQAPAERSLLELTLAGGETAVVVRQPLAAAKSHLSIQRPPGTPSRFVELIDADVVPHVAAPLLQAAVMGRRGILVASAAGLQGHVLLEALCAELDAKERVVAVAPFFPLRLRHDNLISLRAASLQAELRAEAYRAASQLRPDRIIAAGFDGVDARCFLEAAAHLPGSMALVRAVDARTAVQAVVSQAIAGGLDQAAAGSLCASLFSLVLVVGRLPDDRLCLTQVAELRPGPSGPEPLDLFVTTMAGDEEAALPVLVPTGIIPSFLPALVPFGVNLNPEHFSSQTHGLPQVRVAAGAVPVATVQPPVEVAQPLEPPAPSHYDPQQLVSPSQQLDRAPAETAPTLPPSPVLVESIDPGWEVDLMPSPSVPALEPPPTPAPSPSARLQRGIAPQADPSNPAQGPEPSPFDLMLQAKRERSQAAGQAQTYTPQTPPAHPQSHFMGLDLEPPPMPAGFMPAELGESESEPESTDGAGDESDPENEGGDKS